MTLTFLICFDVAQSIDAATHIVAPTADSESGVSAFKVSDGFVKDWGYNNYGGLGLADNTIFFATPQTVAEVPDIVAFGGGLWHSIALRSNGTVIASGHNFYGQLGNGTNYDLSTFEPVRVAAGGAPLSNVVAVSGGSYHNLALKADGTVWVWGYGDGSVNSNVPIQIGASVAGFNGQVIAVDAGYGHSLALTADGKVWAWGGNLYGQLGNGTSNNVSVQPQPVLIVEGGAQLSGVWQISAGEAHSAALKSDGSVVVWGLNNFGQVGNGTTNTTECYCVKIPTATTATAMGMVTSISAGAHHTVALKADGNVWAWGEGNYGAIGDGNTANALIPRQTTISNVVDVRTNAGGSFHGHTLARTRNGSVFAWGSNNAGQIGNGTQTNQTTPLNISLPQGAGGNLGTGITVIGTGFSTSFVAIPQIPVPTGANVRIEGENVRLTYSNVTATGDLQIQAIDPTATGLTAPAGYSILVNSQSYNIVSSAVFTGTATICMKTPTVIDEVEFGKLYILHDDNGDGTLDAGINVRGYQKREICRTTTSFSPFVLATGPSAPTAASASIGGRVLTGKGKGVSLARVYLTDQSGETRTTSTNNFGYYHFAEISAGATYIFSVSHKRYTFAPQVLTVTEDINDLNFTSE